MPVTVVVGGQFGSEGKGKVAHFLAREMGAAAVVRVGGPNSGHTTMGTKEDTQVFRQLPTAAVLPNVHCVLPAGSYIQPKLLLKEIRDANFDIQRLIVDPNAMVVTDEAVSEEFHSDLQLRIGSTQSGTGAAVAARVNRRGHVLLARDEPLLQPFIGHSVDFLRRLLNQGARIIIEGTQGFGLSVLHSPYYPFVTSRDTTAAGFLAEAGLSPLDVDDIAMVIRAFPIRVAGNSGPLSNEISWQEVERESQSGRSLVEYTSVTKKVRRVARFDPDIVRLAIQHNHPSRIFLNHLDYVDGQCAQLLRVTDTGRAFLRRVEELIGRGVNFAGVSPNHLIDLSEARLRRAS